MSIDCETSELLESLFERGLSIKEVAKESGLSEMFVEEYVHWFCGPYWNGYEN